MLGTLALAAAVVFVVLAVVRLRGSAPPSLGTAALVVALVAGGLALARWQGGTDSRWLVAAALMVGGGALTLAKGNRALAIGAIVCGGLGAALVALAMATAR